MKITWGLLSVELDDDLTPAGLYKHFGTTAIVEGAKASAAGQEAFGTSFGESLGTEFGSRVGDATAKQIEKLTPTPENVSATMTGLATNHMDLWTKMATDYNPMHTWLGMFSAMIPTAKPAEPAPGE